MKIAILMPFTSIARCSASTSSLLSVVNRLDIEFPPLANEHLAFGYDYIPKREFTPALTPKALALLRVIRGYERRVRQLALKADYLLE